MISTEKLETVAAGHYAWAASTNARMQNSVNATHFTAADKLKAERIKLVLDFVYYSKSIYINYRKTKIAIKVDNARIKDKVLLKEMEEDWAADGIKKTVTKQGVIYSITK